MQQLTTQGSTTSTFSKRQSHWRPNLRRATAGLGLSLAVALTVAAPSAAIPIEDIPNPRQDNDGWVTDMADMLSPSEEAQLNQLIAELEATEGHEIAVVTVPDTTPAATPKAFTTELFNTWEIGKASEDNGVLFLVSKGDRRTEIEVGYGLEGVLPDAQVGEILRSRVTPEFKQGNFDTGILNGTEALVTVLNGETLAPVANTALPPAIPNTDNRQPIDQTSGAGNAVFLLMMLGIGGLWVLDAVRKGDSSRSGSSSRSRSSSSNADQYSSYNSYSSGSHYNSGSSYSGGSDFGGGSSGGGGGGDSW